MQRMTTLMIVVDEPLYRDGLQFLLARRAPHIHCIAVRTPTEALAQLQGSANPRLLVADHLLACGVDGLAWLQLMGTGWPAIRRVLLTAAEDPALSEHARRAGLEGHFSKTMEPDLWLQALHVILRGERYFSAPASAVAVEPTTERVSPTLNERQISVLQLASAGLGNRQIAQQLHVTERTVKYHLSETFLRLASSSRTEAVAKAAVLGLIRLQGQQIPGEKGPLSSRM
jgi:DNA-binding NarL/FixJ family response regulator